MVENYDLKTASKQITNVIATNNFGIGLVPEGMKRYITYLKINNIAAAATLTVNESDVEAGGGTDTRIDTQKLAAGDTIMYPDSPDAEKPILSIAGGKAITMLSDVATSFEVTFQYYDAP